MPNKTQVSGNGLQVCPECGQEYGRCRMQFIMPKGGEQGEWKIVVCPACYVEYKARTGERLEIIRDSGVGSYPMLA